MILDSWLYKRQESKQLKKRSPVLVYTHVRVRRVCLSIWASASAVRPVATVSDRAPESVSPCDSHVELPYTLDEIDEQAKSLGLDPVEQPDHSSLPQIPGDVLVTASDGHALFDKNSEEFADIHAISDAFKDLRETWARKREEASRMCAFRIRL